MDLATRRMVIYGLFGLLIAGATIAAFQVVPAPFLAKDGTLSIYFSGIQSDILSNQPIATQAAFSSATQPVIPSSGTPAANIVSLNVTIDSASLHKSGDANDSWVPIPHWPFEPPLEDRTRIDQSQGYEPCGLNLGRLLLNGESTPPRYKSEAASREF